MSVTIKDVAHHAGVSSATVSRVLSNKPHVSAEMRRRVLAAVSELGYRPSRVARSLRVKQSRIIGLIISDIQNPFFTGLVRAVEDVAHENQYAVFLCNSDEDIEKERLYIDLMLAEQVAGMLITPTRENDNPSRKVLDAGIPVVAVDRRMLDLDVDTVLVDNVGGAFTLVNHLIEAGHRRIGTIVAPPSTTTGRERGEGYRKALEAHHLPLLPELVCTGPPKCEFGYRLAEELLDLPEPPSAIFCGNNLLTIGALQAIRKRHLQIPDDIALAAFDDMEWATMIEPPLTTVEQPTYELGRAAAELLLKRLEDGARSFQDVILKTRLHIRQSSQKSAG